MERIITEIPPQEVLEWFISGGSGGKDGKGVAVRLNLETRQLEPDRSFTDRVLGWKQQMDLHLDDPYQLVQMPDVELFNAYLAGRAHYNLTSHLLELKRPFVV